MRFNNSEGRTTCSISCCSLCCLLTAFALLTFAWTALLAAISVLDWFWRTLDESSQDYFIQRAVNSLGGTILQDVAHPPQCLINCDD